MEGRAGLVGGGFAVVVGSVVVEVTVGLVVVDGILVVDGIVVVDGLEGEVLPPEPLATDPSLSMLEVLLGDKGPFE